MIKLLILILCGLAGFLVIRAMNKNKMTENRTTDGQVVELLKHSGSAIEQPHEIEFFLYFPKEESARKVATTLESEGYRITPIHINSHSGEWSVVATKSMVPDEETFEALRTSMEALAKEQGGEYDGWGAAHVN